MDAFESVVGEILHRDGYWIQPSVKVGLTKEEKRQIGRPSRVPGGSSISSDTTRNGTSSLSTPE